MNIVQTNLFFKTVKKLNVNQKADLDVAVKLVMNKPKIGQAKAGDLSNVYVYKFNMSKQLTLLAYIFQDETETLTLLALGSRENFYRDLKRSI